ncbi:MAG: metal-dependent hydrolase [Bacteroidetes bacterium]|nr:metal-dependent hydrolase [Bacteroidota bacterium]
MKVRHPKFDLQKKLVRHYFKGNVFSTHLANSLHIIFPEGEKFFIRSCRKFLNKIDNDQLKKEVKAFMGQEGMHAVAHNDFWKYLGEQGFNVAPFANFIDKTAFEGVEKMIYQFLGEERGSEFCLAMTAGLEHYTALLAEVAFENEDEFKHLPDEMKHLFFWHAAEEIEHKSVAFDLMKAVHTKDWIKNAGFTVATVLLFTYAITGQFYFTMTDKESKSMDWPEEYWDFAESLGSPMVRKFAKNMLAYFRDDFHPSKMQNDHYATEFFAKHERYHTTIPSTYSKN